MSPLNYVCYVFQKGIYADMAAGIRKSKLMLACISDEVRKLSLFLPVYYHRA